MSELLARDAIWSLIDLSHVLSLLLLRSYA